MTKRSVKHDIETAAAADNTPETSVFETKRVGRIGLPTTFTRHVNALRATSNNSGMAVYELFITDDKFNRWLDFSVDSAPFVAMVPANLERQAQYAVDWNIEYQPKNGVLVLLSIRGEPLTLKGLDFNAAMQDKWTAELVRIWRKYDIPEQDQSQLLSEAFNGSPVADYFAAGHQWSHAVNRLLTVVEPHHHAASLRKSQAVVEAYQNEQREAGTTLDAWFGPKPDRTDAEPPATKTVQALIIWFDQMYNKHQAGRGGLSTKELRHKWAGVESMRAWTRGQCDQFKTKAEQMFNEYYPIGATMTDTTIDLKKQWTDWAQTWIAQGYTIAQILRALSDAMESDATIKRFGEFKFNNEMGTLEDAERAMHLYVQQNATMPALPSNDFAGDDEPSEPATELSTPLPAPNSPDASTVTLPVIVAQTDVMVNNHIFRVTAHAGESGEQIAEGVMALMDGLHRIAASPRTREYGAVVEGRDSLLMFKINGTFVDAPQVQRIGAAGSTGTQPVTSSVPALNEPKGVANCIMISMGKSFGGGKPQLNFECDGMEHALHRTNTDPTKLVQLLAKVKKENGQPFTLADLSEGRKHGGAWRVCWQRADKDNKTYHNVIDVLPA